MARRSCDGAGLLMAFRSAVANLEASVEEINALNVFPVPDGDTGTNMLATVKAALEEADRSGAGGDADAERVAGAARLGALMGARGNSGVITSQILAGIADGLVGKRRFNGLDLAHALDAGTRMAYKAVARPVEGTILTVIREASAAAVAAAERDNDVESVLAATVDAAERAVAKTPSLLPVLREAHVVDSGGQGLFRLLQGALEAARGRPVDAAHPSALAAHGTRPTTESTASGAVEGEYGYETVYLLKARGGQPLDLPAIAAHLEVIGDSVLVAGDQHLVKVHVHNDRPDAVIAYGLTVGTLSRITIENLDGQAHEVREAKAAAFIGEGATAEGGRSALAPVGLATAAGTAAQDPMVATRLPLGIVAVVPSEGLEHLFAQHTKGLSEFVSITLVRGGQSANPSTGELLEAVAATPADEVLLLPNNPNVILAARQVAAMADRPVHVVPTRNCAEGLAALLGLDPSDPPDENVAAMTRASRDVQTLQVTEAVRDATVSGRKVKKGQTIALDPDDGLVAVDNDPHKAVLAAMSKLEPGYSIVTVYYGEGSSLEDAEGLLLKLRESNRGLEDVDVQNGGQPHYRYLIAAE